MNPMYSAMDISYIFIRLFSMNERSGVSLKKLETLCFLLQCRKVAESGELFFEDPIFIGRDRPIIPSLEESYCSCKENIIEPAPSFAKEDSGKEGENPEEKGFCKEDFMILLHTFLDFGGWIDSQMSNLFEKEGCVWKEFLLREGEVLSKEDMEKFWKGLKRS